MKTKIFLVLAGILLLVMADSAAADTLTDLRSKMIVLLEGEVTDVGTFLDTSPQTYKNNFENTTEIEQRTECAIVGTYGIWSSGTGFTKVFNDSGDIFKGPQLRNTTVCMWYNVSGGGDTKALFQWRDAEQYKLLKVNHDANPNKYFYKQDGISSSYTDADFTGDQFNWMCFVSGANGTLFFYINNTLRGQVGGWDGTPDNDVLAFSIFNRYDAVAEGINGCFDQFVVFSDNLTIAEMDYIWNGGFGRSLQAVAGQARYDMNITIDYPQESELINSFYIIANNSDIYLNVSHNGTGNYTVGLSTTDFSLDYNTSSGGLQRFVFRNNTPLADGNYSIIAFVNRSHSNNASYIRNFTIDTTDPVIIAKDDLFFNRTIVYNGTLSTQVNFTDNLGIWSVEINFSNMTQIYNKSGINLTEYSYNISVGVGERAADYIIVKVCDGHTLNGIPRFDRIDYVDAGIRYVTNNKPFLGHDDYIQITPEITAEFNIAETFTAKDRYKFIFNKKSAPSPVERFTVYSTTPIEIIQESKYAGHLIIPGQGENGYWIDFTNPDAANIIVTRVSDYEVDIQAVGIKSGRIQFDSIGELNCIKQNFFFGNLNPQEGFDVERLVGGTSTFLLNVTLDPITMDSINATLWFNSTIYYGGTTQNYSKTITLPDNVIHNSTNITWNWQLFVNSNEYNLTTRGLNVSNIWLDNTSRDGYVEVLDIILRNATNDAQITGYMEGTFDYTTGSVSKSYSFDTFDNGQKIYIFPGYATVDSNIIIEYSSIDSAKFSYVSNKTLTNASETLNLYVESATTAVVLIVYDENGNELENCEITVDKWDSGTGSYFTTQVLTTDTNGEAIANLVLNDNWYRFTLRYDGRVVLTTNKQQIAASPKEFYVIIGVTPESVLLKMQRLDITLEAFKIQQTFNLTWNDINDSASQLNFTVWTGNLTSNDTTLYSVALLDPSGTDGYYINVPTNTSISYVARVKALSIDDGRWYLIDSKTLSYMKEYDIFDEGDSLIGMWLLLGTITFLAFFISPIAGLAVMGLSFVGVVLFGLIQLAWTWVMGILIIIGILFVRLNNR